MKKGMTCLSIFLMIVFFQLLVHAQVAIQQDIDSGSITVSGNVGSQTSRENVIVEVVPVKVDNGTVTVTANYDVTNESDIFNNIPYISQQKTGANGSYQFTFRLSSDHGWYAVKIKGNSDEEMSAPLYYANADEVKLVLESISNESDPAKIEKIIADNSAIIGFKFQPYNDLLSKKRVCTEVEKKDYGKVSDLIIVLKQASFYDSFRQASDSKYAADLILNYGMNYGIESLAGYNIYSNLQDKTIFGSYIKGNDITNNTSFESFFNCAAILSAIASPISMGDAEDILKNEQFAKYLKIDFTDYDKLGNKKSIVLSKVVGIPFKNIDEMVNAFNQAVQDAKSQKTITTGDGGSSKDSKAVVQSVTTPVENINTGGNMGNKVVFLDLDSASWAKVDIEKLYELGAINGMENGKFEPNSTITREQLLKMIIEVFKITPGNGESNFSDVDSTAWYAKYINTGVSHGIINGIDSDRFGTGESINREQIAVMIGRTIGLKDIEKSDANFVDKSNISNYAYDLVKQMTSIGIIKGFETNEFRPQALATRAEAACIIMRAYRYIKGE